MDLAKNKRAIIRKVSLADLLELKSISTETFYESFIHGNTEKNMQDYMASFFSEINLKKEMTNPASAFYFLLLDDRLSGYMKINTGNAQTDLKESDGVEIERIYVKKEMQGKNSGQLLFDVALKIAAEYSATYLWLGVWEKNLRAIKFYERNGMQIFSSHPFKLGDDDQTDLLMKRML